MDLLLWCYSTERTYYSGVDSHDSSSYIILQSHLSLSTEFSHVVFVLSYV